MKRIDAPRGDGPRAHASRAAAAADPTRRAALAGVLALAAAPAVRAQSAPFPQRPVTIVVPFPPGGGTDTGARIVAQSLAARWGQPVVVENRGGAAGQIGAEHVSKARPDGHVLLMGNIGTQAINPSLYPRLPYDPDRAFAPVSLVAALPLALMVHPSLPVRTPAEFVAYAKARPGKLSYSSSGAGGGPHLAAEMFKQATGTFVLHVPYRGGGPAIADLLAGHVELSFMTVLEAIGHVRSGKLRALAVTGARRVPALPEVPTLSETILPGFDSISWIGLLAPAGTPAAVVERISADVRELIATPETTARIVDLGGVPQTTTPAQFEQLIATDRARYAAIIRERRITTD